MRRVNSGKRFPRGSLVRKLSDIQQTVWWWHYRMLESASEADTPEMEARLLERAAAFDHIWHELGKGLLALLELR